MMKTLQGRNYVPEDKPILRKRLLDLLALFCVLKRVDTARDLYNIVFSGQECKFIPNNYDFVCAGSEFAAPYSPELNYDLIVLELEGFVTDGYMGEPIYLTKKGDELVNQEAVESIRLENIKKLAVLDVDSLADIAKYLMIRKILNYNPRKTFEKATQLLFNSKDRTKEIISRVERLSK